MKYVLLFGLIALATLVSGEEVDSTKYYTFLNKILNDLANRKNDGISYKLVKINKVYNVTLPNDVNDSCTLKADLKDENDKVQNCLVQISLHRKYKDATGYTVRFYCNKNILGSRLYGATIYH